MEPMEIKGGPFNFEVHRLGRLIALKVIGKKGDVLTQIEFAEDKLDHMIEALRVMKQ